MKKRIKWDWDMGCYVAFCPYCGEIASYEDKCEFCGQEYEWAEPKYKPTIVEVGEYTVIQATNNHISIIKDDKMLCHVSCTRKMTEQELIKQVENYEKLMQMKIEDKGQN